MIFALDEEIAFPDPRLGEPDGLFAVGGDLSTDRLLLAYSYGIFPWYSFRDSDEPMWYCPMDRFVIFRRRYISPTPCVRSSTNDDTASA